MENQITIGQLLKQARKKKNVSLEDVANKTKININLLRSLERDDLEALPNKTYVRGFVKNCAKILQVESQEALEALKRTYQKYEPEQTKDEQENAGEAPSEENNAAETSTMRKDLQAAEMQHRLRGILDQLFNKKIFIAVAALVALALIVKGMISFFSSINSEKESLAKAQVQDEIKPKEASLFEMDAAKKLANEATTDPKEAEADIEAEATPSSSQAAKDESEPQETSFKPAEKKPSEPEEKENVENKVPAGKLPHKNFYPAPRNMFTLNGEAEILNNEEVLPPNYRAAMKTDGHNLFVHALEGDTWLSYQADDEDIKRFVLKKGRTLLIQAKEKILIFFGNLNVAKVFYNNKLVEAQTKSGVKSLIFPEEKAADYDLPLFPSYKGIPYKQDYYKENMLDKEQES